MPPAHVPGFPGRPAPAAPAPTAPAAPAAGFGRGSKAVGAVAASVVVAALLVGGGLLLAGGGPQSQAAASPLSPAPSSAPVSSARSAAAGSSPLTAPAGQAGPAAPGGPPPASPSGLPYVKLAPGTCFDIPALDSRVSAVSVRPCRGPHDGEAITQEALGGTFADDGQLRAQALALCAPDARKRLRSIPRDGREYYYYAIYPALSTYRAAGEKTVTCALTLSNTVDGRQLTAPLP